MSESQAPSQPHTTPNPPSSSPESPIEIAILDDYVSIAPSIFSSHLSPSSTTNTKHTISISSSPSTLDPTQPAELTALIARLAPYTIISTMRERTPFPASLLSQLPNLRLLLTTGMRNNAIDLASARSHGIAVVGTKNTASPNDPTTQQTWALLLALVSRVPAHDQDLKAGNAWQAAGFARPLDGLTYAAMGLGKLGARSARIASQAFGMHVLCWSQNLTQEKADQIAVEQGVAPGTFKVVASKEELCKRADVLSLHLVLSDRTRGVVGAKELGAMKQSAFLVNAARAGLVDEDALFDTLNAGRIQGAAMDVFWKEPLPVDSRWRNTQWGREGRSEVVMSPHMGYVNEKTLRGWYEEQAARVEEWLEGREVKNVLN